MFGRRGFADGVDLGLGGVHQLLPVALRAGDQASGYWVWERFAGALGPVRLIGPLVLGDGGQAALAELFPDSPDAGIQAGFFQRADRLGDVVQGDTCARHIAGPPAGRMGYLSVYRYVTYH